MAEIVSLNRVRKAKAKGEAGERAQANRVTFGLSKAEKAAARAEAERCQAQLAGKKIDQSSDQ